MSHKGTNSEPVQSIQVTIFDQTYTLRSTSGGEYIRRMAELVDERMREISSLMATVDTTKIAILAALNIADELESMRDAYERHLEAIEASLGPEGADGDREPPERVERKKNDARSWFDAIFDDEEAPPKKTDRLSSQISAKLQSLRQPATDADDERR